ncbi:MAG: TonB-dependent receptor [Bacteroidia bacterium]|nr:TonB-dependent receptor [Bacteroidia bacterium]
MRPILTACMLLVLACSASAQSYTISGYVRDAASGEALIGSTLQATAPGAPRRGGFTNSYGFFSLTLPAGSYRLIASYIGHQPDTQEIRLDRSLSLDIRLQEIGATVAEVVISAAKDANAQAVKSTQMGQINLNVRDIRLVPTLGGETDILKVMQLLPGVTKGGEGSTSILVRGGDPDQNLILLDEAVVYNVSHLFGFFSVFNPDALKDVNLLKGGFPAQYGGRLSSVIDITMNEGNMKSWHVKGGIGLLSSRLTVEGPIIKDKASFIVSGRRSYIDQVLRLVRVPVPYYFYDLNVKANYIISEKDRLYLSGYFGDDVLYTPRQLTDDSAGIGEIDFGFRLGNFTSTLRWNHLFSPRLFSNTSLIFTRFKYNINGDFEDNSIFIGSDVNDIALKSDYSYYLSPEHTLRFGMNVIAHRFRPNVISAEGDIDQIIEEREPDPLLSQEYAVYGLHEWQLLPQLRVNYGLRLSAASVQGAFYANAEPRIAGVWVLNDRNSFKAGYTRMAQYVHLVSSSTVALPTDLWYPVTDQIRPQHADQVAGSFTHNFEKAGLLFTVEGYYKRMRNLTEYREGANLILNDKFQDELLQGKGWAYGSEFLLKRDEGRITGWIGYTLSFSRRQFDGLNGGEAYWAKYDRRHDLSVVAIWKIWDRLTFSAVYSYLSGARFTPQIGQYLIPNPSLTGVEIVPIYSKRNEIRLSSAQRVDVTLTLSNKPTKKLHSEWSIGCYNLLNQPTPIRVRIDLDENGALRYSQPSFLGRVLSIAWNFEL